MVDLIGPSSWYIHLLLQLKRGIGLDLTRDVCYQCSGFDRRTVRSSEKEKEEGKKKKGRNNEN